MLPPTGRGFNGHSGLIRFSDTSVIGARPKRAREGGFPLFANSMVERRRGDSRLCRRTGSGFVIRHAGQRLPTRQMAFAKDSGSPPTGNESPVGTGTRCVVHFGRPTPNDSGRGPLTPIMLLAQSGKSRGFGSRAPKGHRSTRKPDEPYSGGVGRDDILRPIIPYWRLAACRDNLGSIHAACQEQYEASGKADPAVIILEGIPTDFWGY
jgi:hypothetical protein